MTRQEMKTQQDRAFAEADAILSASEQLGGPMTAYATKNFDSKMREAKALGVQIAATKPKTTERSVKELRAELNSLPESSALSAPRYDGNREPLTPSKFSREYHTAFLSFATGAGPLTASLQEGTGVASGGAAVPVIVSENVVPLAPVDAAVRSLATTVATRCDIAKLPMVTGRATAAAKGEGSNFTLAQPTIGSFALSAYGVGIAEEVSFELLKDAPWYWDVLLADAVDAFLEFEESYFVGGSGSGQPQGLIGNVGAGVTTEPDAAGNLVSVDAVWQLVASLKEAYAKGASFLMSKATALGIRRAQVQATPGFFEPIFHRENGIDLCAGYPVAYSSQMPAAARGNTPVLFGDFARGYLIGDRGGPALFVKKLDQANALEGLVTFLFFRRTDGRVRCPEAVQSLTIAAS